MRIELLGENPTLLWGMTNAERVTRIAREQGWTLGPGEGDAVRVDLAYAFDPAWLRHVAARPGSRLTYRNAVVLDHGDSGELLAAEDERGIFDEALRKRERPFVLPLTPANVPAIERASYQGAYKGVTDLLTKYLWPQWAFHLTRLAARIGATPNMVTALGTVLCVVATMAFWCGWFWSGLATGLLFMVLDTVDGKLARCTITSSKLGNAWDHGIDLVHPPFWWWAWGVGCAAYGRPLSDETFWIVMATMLVGYVAQRLIEGAFILRFGMHIHVWERFDSRFRLVTARRNPNMVLLFAGLLVGRPDWGIVAVAAWTTLSLVVHLVRLLQAIAARAQGRTIVSWLA
ncbi:MAG: CDP-alcohol phosphatidyltransferase family protein [Pseudomonadota bacterium]